MKSKIEIEIEVEIELAWQAVTDFSAFFLPWGGTPPQAWKKWEKFVTACQANSISISISIFEHERRRRIRHRPIRRTYNHNRS